MLGFDFVCFYVETCAVEVDIYPIKERKLMPILSYNEDAAEAINRADYFRITMRYEAAILCSIVINRVNIASDVLARLKVKPSSVFSHTQNLISEDGDWISEEEHSAQRTLGCEPETIRNEASRHALSMGNNYIGTEHILLATATSSRYIEEFLASQSVNIDQLRSAIVAKQSEPKLTLSKNHNMVRLIFRTIDLANTVDEFNYITKALDSSADSLSSETYRARIKLQEWHPVRMKNVNEGRVLRQSIIDEFPWINY